ncbi:MAG TPA: zf-TFIIB domain-containing protein [Victivallales bacterium]|nr:zf-TFIIB domain-containing protein [Victivallales bacterium]
MKCQKCDVEFKKRDIQGVNVEYCPDCLGVFLHHGELRKITHKTTGDIEYASIENFDPENLFGMNCPLCRDEKMVKINFVSYSDISLGYCSKCKGIWLDKGELELINKEIDKLNMDPENWEHSICVFLAKLPF